MSDPFPHLFSEASIGEVELKNRVVASAHHTYLADGAPNERLIAYHEKRAAGGVGLIVSEITVVHDTAGFSSCLLNATDRRNIPGFARLAQSCHKHGAKIFAQLFHPGREILSAYGGMLPIAYAPSAVPNERFHIMPKPMPVELIHDVIAGYAVNAQHLAEAGYDGVEIVASHGYLPAQFLNPRVNIRDDDYGGDDIGRLRFLTEIIESIRKVSNDLVVGIRISGSDIDGQSLTTEEVINICRCLEYDLDYISVVAGTSASLGGSVHIVPPMGLDSGYVAAFSFALKKECAKPIIATGRINQPQIAEQIIAQGRADLCGMTRALICDPQLPAKAQENRVDDIRACIACNQACIGRAHKGLGISCIQYPESGRELEYSQLQPAEKSKNIWVVGGGPAGMKAAAVAAARGHNVALYEKEKLLGGQVQLAQRLPGRDEFGGIVNNLTREMELAGVNINTSHAISKNEIIAADVDNIILATGARPHVPLIQGLDEMQTVTAWEVLKNRAQVGQKVIIADWRADWIGLGLAEQFSRLGHDVTLCVNAAMAGESLQIYTRNYMVGRLHELNVTIKTHLRLFGGDEDTVYFQDTLTHEAVVMENVDSLILSLGHVSESSLESEISDLDIKMKSIGDCVVPRTAEEAVYEGLLAAWNI